MRRSRNQKLGKGKPNMSDTYEDYDGEFGEEYSEGSLKINLSDKEAKAEGKDFEPLPRGWYHVALTDGEVKAVKELDADGNPNKNAGKPYWRLEFTVQSGKYEGRKAFTNAMLFQGAAYTLVQLLKSTGFMKPDQSAGEVDIPPLDDIIGKEMEVRVVVVPARGDYDARNEVKAIRALSGDSDGLATEADDLP